MTDGVIAARRRGAVDGRGGDDDGVAEQRAGVAGGVVADNGHVVGAGGAENGRRHGEGRRLAGGQLSGAGMHDRVLVRVACRW